MTEARVQTSSPHAALAGLPRLLPPAPLVDFDDHMARYGALPRLRSRHERAAFFDSVARSGLRGRGGAGFPTARKLQAVANHGRRPVVVANGCEGEPASRKDAVLLTTAPHLVLDGAILSAHALHADEIFVVVDRNNPVVLSAVAEAIAQRADDVATRLVGMPSRYVAGEETAVVNFLNGGAAKPTSIPPRPYERGVRGRPSLIQNVETLANIALIARFGVDWFASVGTVDEPGSVLLTASGAVAHPGVYEVELGMPCAELLETIEPRDEPAAVLLGGYFGRWLPYSTFGELRISHRSATTAGGMLGCGVIGVLPAEACGVAETARIARYLAQESAQQCGPCMYGLDAIAGAVEQLARGDVTKRTSTDLHRWLRDVAHRGSCHLPDASIGFVASALEVFSADFEMHERYGRCLHHDPRPVLPLPDAATRDWTWR